MRETGEGPALHVRRIVTGHDDDGRSVVITDAAAPTVKIVSDRVRAVHFWATFATPVPLESHSGDGADRMSGTPPPCQGTRFGMLEIEPGNLTGTLHQTDTVDYVICLVGSIDLHLDGDVVAVRSGDVVIQRGTNHTWINTGTETARLAFIMIDAGPKRAGSLGADDQAT